MVFRKISRDKSPYTVKKKYGKFTELMHKQKPGMMDNLLYLNEVHHGLPDFVCYRQGQFKFIECKLRHEQLSKAQKKCIRRLQKLGFEVEVHKLVDKGTKARAAAVDLSDGEKIILERQASLNKKTFNK